jgi:hypothetical protein
MIYFIVFIVGAFLATAYLVIIYIFLGEPPDNEIDAKKQPKKKAKK